MPRYESPYDRDDPYDGLAKANYPAKQLLITDTTVEQWFPFDPSAGDAQQAADEATSCAHIGRRVVDLAVWNSVTRSCSSIARTRRAA